eukprot:TRINITY_DN1786_c0_g1_i1.p1 TRINITY_DN1786_c0_g1~~TRINITY_DN1786_c0_g1_i1.p1  ORF type:complete len:353 (+),score=82.10 TRINITY_DN1786_c0_g1_i1:61-1119(+)
MNTKPNVVTDLTLKTLNNLKTTVPPLVQEFVKLAQKYQQQCSLLAAAGVALADSVYKIGNSVNSDMGEALRKLGEAMREEENKREELARALVTDLITPIKQAADTDVREVLMFEKNYKKDRDTLRNEILRLEAKTKKLGSGKKTSPEQLKSQIQELNDRVREAELMRSNKMRDVVLLERKKYGAFIGSWNFIITRQIESHSSALNNLRAGEATWSALPSTMQSAPKDVEEMIKKQDRTLVQIQSSEGGASQSVSSPNLRLSFGPGAIAGYESYADYDSYDTQAYTPQPGEGGELPYQGRVLYDYAGEEETDLPLTAGETLTIVQHDDGSGWTKGQNFAGQIGIFPSTYIELF